MEPRTDIARILSGRPGPVRLRAWVLRRADQGDLMFLTLRDGTGFVQAVVSRGDVDASAWAAAAAAGPESSIEIRGEAAADPRAPGGVEVRVAELIPIQAVAGYPLAGDRDPDFLLARRHLWLRTPRQRALLLVRASAAAAVRGFLAGEGFVEVAAPVLTRARECEPSRALAADYFGDRAYLSGSGRLYMAAAAAALGRAYCFGPVFAAPDAGADEVPVERWLAEPEAAWLDRDGAMDLAERLVAGVVGRVADECGDLLAAELDRDPGPLRRAAAGGFPRPGGPVAEGLPLFFDAGPRSGREIDRAPAAGGTGGSGFVLVGGSGGLELVRGGERTTDPVLLGGRIDALGLSRRDLDWVLDLGRYGSFTHAGFAVDLERMTAWIAGTGTLREIIPFPRFRSRLHP